MSDFKPSVSLTAEHVANLVGRNPEKLVFTTTMAIMTADALEWREAVQKGYLSMDIDEQPSKGILANRLRQLADAIDRGDVS